LALDCEANNNRVRHNPAWFTARARRRGDPNAVVFTIDLRGRAELQPRVGHSSCCDDILDEQRDLCRQKLPSYRHGLQLARGSWNRHSSSSTAYRTTSANPSREQSPDWHSSHGPANASELEDELAGSWRIRLDDYRIIYSIDDEVVTVEIVRAGGVTWR
jgi:hypothetical protein